MNRSLRIVAVGLLAAPLLSACRATTPAGAPAPESAPASPAAPAPAAPAAASSAGARRHAPADAEFMRGMMAHHAQAIVMARLVPERTRRQDLRALAGRIAVSQHDEIAQMRAWLERRGEAVPAVDTSAAPGAHAAHAGAAGTASAGGHDAHGAHAGMAAMPGMLSAEDLARLATLRGPAFEALFLDRMIRHHEGALTMVARLFATPGAAQEPETFQFASDVDADQRAEIARMRTLRNALPR